MNNQLPEITKGEILEGLEGVRSDSQCINVEVSETPVFLSLSPLNTSRSFNLKLTKEVKQNK